jgi:hypothetical protein
VETLNRRFKFAHFYIVWVIVFACTAGNYPAIQISFFQNICQ